jgi:hypothetical protein
MYDAKMIMFEMDFFLWGTNKTTEPQLHSSMTSGGGFS